MPLFLQSAEEDLQVGNRLFGSLLQAPRFERVFFRLQPLALVAQLFEGLVDVGLFLRDLGPLFHEGDAGRLEFFVLLSQLRPGRLGLFAGDFERPLIGFVLRVQFGIFFLVAFDLLGRFARLLPIVLEVLARRLEGDPLVADVVLGRLERFALRSGCGPIRPGCAWPAP